MADARLLNILIVDDDPDAQEMFVLAFQRVGVSSRIECVGSGSEAVEYVRGEGHFSDRQRFPYPSLLITDLKMPHGDGFSLLEQLKSTPPYRVIPTIVMSTSSDEDDIRRSYMLGASSYFVKPTGFEALERLLKLIHELWLLAELPAVDASGKQLATNSAGKLGERFQQGTPQVGDDPKDARDEAYEESRRRPRSQQSALTRSERGR